MKKIFAIILILLGVSFAFADSNFEEAISIIESKTPCRELSEDQLELIGDYYMEQMHPGEAHERMDQMMGGEGSESLRNVHINIARSFYCGERNAMPMNMMNTLMGRGGNNMPYNMMNYGIFGFNYFLMLIFWVALIVLVIWIILKLVKGKEEKSALEVLKHRYAKGEISKKEFESTKKDL